MRESIYRFAPQPGNIWQWQCHSALEENLSFLIRAKELLPDSSDKSSRENHLAARIIDELWQANALIQTKFVT